MKGIFISRRICQILIIILFIIVPWANSRNYNFVQGSLFSLDLFSIPFADPASAAQAALSGALDWQWPIFKYFLGALLSLGVAFLLGRVFCGWICPYGFFSEIFHSIRIKNNPSFSAKKQKAIWITKFGLIAILLLAGALLAFPLITFLSIPGQLSLIPIGIWRHIGEQALLALAILPFIAIVCEFIFKRRLWCEFICPQSVFLGISAWALPKIFPGLRISWNPKKCVCGANSPCAQVCSININPRHKNGPDRKLCVMCGDCVEACKKCGKALKFSFTVRRRDKQPVNNT